MIDMTFYVYILHSTNSDKYYIGQTDDLTDRLSWHNAGYEAFTSKYRPWALIWYTEKPSRSAAIILERKLKNLSRLRLEAFIQKYK